MPCQRTAQPPTTVTYSCEDIVNQNLSFQTTFTFCHLLQRQASAQVFSLLPSVKLVPIMHFFFLIHILYSLIKKMSYRSQNVGSSTQLEMYLMTKN